MLSDFNSTRFLSSTYRSTYRQLNRLPKNKWTLLVLATVLVLIDHWFLWPVVIVAAVLGLAWLVRVVVLRRP